MATVQSALSDIGRGLRAALAGLSQPLRGDGRPRIPTRLWPDVLRRVRSHDFSGHSDLELGDALGAFSGRPRGQDAIADTLPQVFALVSEAVRRRLGAWRLFDPDYDGPRVDRYRELATEILEGAPYRGRVDFYTDPEFLETDAFGASVEPLLREMALDATDRDIVRTMVYVAEKGKLEYPADILLPAGFYRALSAKDIGSALSFDATDEQLLAGLLLYEGTVVEMNAGEGKTIAAAFPAVLHALAGESVHIITANDYLAARDAEWLAPVYESLGLTVGAVLGHMGDDERRHAYAQQIVYGTLRELGFDFLRDNLKLPPDRPVQGDLQVAIVDEADHALIDQARTPLIISGEPSGSRRAFDRTRRAVEEIVSLQADKAREIEARLRDDGGDSNGRVSLVARLLLAAPDSRLLRRESTLAPRLIRRAKARIDGDEYEDHDQRLSADLLYVVDSHLRWVMLTEKGQQLLEGRLGSLFDTRALERKLSALRADGDLPLEERRQADGRLRRLISRQHSQMNQVYQMLRAHVLLKRGVDYLVTDGAVLLIDELTGRTLPDSRYQRGLHAALEAKEGVGISPECETLAQISVQGLIRQYAHVGGMTGTALSARDELKRWYGLPVVPLPPTHPGMRVDLPTRLYPERSDKLAAIVDEVKSCRRVGRPVLVGTVTVEQSEEMSRLLDEHGVRHVLLNAVETSAEAEIIRNAGAFGAVTISTNMAGRGTDIVLEPGLDGRIVDGYVSLIEELLDQGAGTVEVVCGTGAEALALREGLLASGGLRIARGSTGRPRRPVLTVSPEGAPDSHRRERLEVGLGLYVIGTEMNQSERIDRQLRGRSGRQGAFGASRFILSEEDRSLALRDRRPWIRSGGLRTDADGRSVFEGLGLQQHLASTQAEIERDDEAGRVLSYEDGRALEAQALAYYKARREVIESESFHSACEGFVRACAERLVERYFPQDRPFNYAVQFERLCEELWVDFEADCYHLEGTGLDALPEHVAGVLLARLDLARASLGEAELDRLEMVLFLQTADELWRVHAAETQEQTLGISLSTTGHKAALAEYVVRCSESYGQLKADMADAFVSRLLTFSLERVPTAGETEVELDAEVARILA